MPGKGTVDTKAKAFLNFTNFKVTKQCNGGGGEKSNCEFCFYGLTINMVGRQNSTPIQLGSDNLQITVGN